MNNNGFKKVNLIPQSFFLLKQLKTIRLVSIILGLVILLAMTCMCFTRTVKLSGVEKEIKEANKIIAEADFETLNELKLRLETLQNATDSGNFNSIPNVYEDMTDFLTCVVENMPATMKLNSIDGEFTTAGVYSYSFSFSSSERSTIAKFLQDLQNEEILKFVNVSAITLTGGETSAEDTDQTVTQGSDGLWDFTLVVKTKGGAQ